MLHSRPVRFFFLIGSASLLFVWLCDVYRLSQYKPLYPDPPKFRFFHWDTKPFLEPFSEAKVSSPCDRFPQRVFNNVQVVLKTGLTESPERIQSHLKSVTKCFPNLLIVSDYDGIVNEYHVHDVLADLSEAYSLDNPDFDTYYTQKAMLEANNITEYNNQAGWKLDRFKFLPMVHKAYTMHQTAYWFVFIETDTYIFWDNLLRMLENLDPLVPQYIGSPLHGDGLMYAYGGSGIVLSRAAIEALLDRETDGHGSYTSAIIYEQDEWVERVKKTTYGEMVLGEALLERADVKLSGYFPMFYPLNIESLEFSNDVWCVPIISVHKLQTLEQYEELWSWEMGPGDDNPIVFYTVFTLVRPRLEPQRYDWNNFASDLSINISAHTNLDSCRDNCLANSTCVQYMYHRLRCYTSATIGLGGSASPSTDGGNGLPMPYISGWDLDLIDEMVRNVTCSFVHWLKPENERHWMG